MDYPQIRGMLDVVLPMIYLGNYHKDIEWLKETTRWFVENSNGAQVWSGIQGYSSADYNEAVVTKSPLSQLNIDIRSELDSNASGVIVFRYGITPDIDFNDLSIDEEELKSFSYLNYWISNAKLPLTLDRDITFNDTFDSRFINGIRILKNNLIIDGNNHVVDAGGMPRIFNITGKNNTIMNFIFINAFADKGGAIYVSGNDTKIVNCTFINDIASTEAGSIFLRAPCGQIINSTFINSTAIYTGAVLINSVNASVIGSYFANSRANISAGALGLAAKDNGIIGDCIFVDNGAYNEGGGALFWNQGKNGLIANSTFINNHANFNGSAIFWSFGDDGLLPN